MVILLLCVYVIFRLLLVMVVLIGVVLIGMVVRLVICFFVLGCRFVGLLFSSYKYGKCFVDLLFYRILSMWVLCCNFIVVIEVFDKLKGKGVVRGLWVVVII